MENDSVPDVVSTLGMLASHLPGYEMRLPQLALAKSIERAFDTGKTGIFEAGTGIGKSLAALVPAVLSRKKVVVSTATISLQEQYIKKDIPLLQKLVPFEFNYALLKGRGNYAGIRRFNDFVAESNKSNAIDDEFVEWLNETDTGDVSELDFMPPLEIWQEINSDGEDCLRQRCPNFSDCFYFGAREAAEHADILVVNHNLLLVDAASGGNVLPKYDLLIIDEAHHLNDIATEAFSSQISSRGLKRLRAKATKQLNAPMKLLEDIEFDSHALFHRLRNDFAFNKKRVRQSIAEAEPMLMALHALRNWIEAQDYENVLDVDLAREKLKLKAKAIISTIDRYIKCLDLLKTPDSNWVIYVEQSTNPNHENFSVTASPLDVSGFIADNLFAKAGLHSTVCMSATLATAGDDPFDYFKSSVGVIGPVVQDKFQSPFDYKHQSMLFLPGRKSYNLPNPNDAGYISEASRVIEELIELSHGRAFILFTSRSALFRAFEIISKRLPYEARRQGEMPRNKLLEWFKVTPNAVLFGTSSFWEGVSVDGDQLSLVVIDRIPFQAPDDPIYEARCERLKDGGEKNWFGDLALPYAITRLKQGVGRLIRTQTDRGVVAILDPRLTEKAYGQKIIECLPPMSVTHSMHDLPNFFNVNSLLK